MTSDLSTLAGQKAHYATVKARLGRPAAQTPQSRSVRTIRTSRVIATWPPYHAPAPYDFCDPEKPLSVRITARMIIAEVAAKHGLTVIHITGSVRTKPVVRARHEAIYRIREELQFSWAQIGNCLGRLDHTAVLYGWRQHRSRMEAGE